MLIVVLCLWEEIQNGSSINGATAYCVRRREGMDWINVAWNRDSVSGFCEICKEPSGLIQWKGI